jgi:hypothetical protein
LAECKAHNRIGVIGADPLMTLRAYWDIGGTGAKADACAIWIVQFVGEQVRVLDYYEAVGQELSAHVAWLRAKGYEKAQCVLPHDGVTHDKVYRVTYESALRRRASTPAACRTWAQVRRRPASKRCAACSRRSTSTTNRPSRARCAGLVSREERRGARDWPGAGPRLVEPCR